MAGLNDLTNWISGESVTGKSSPSSMAMLCLVVGVLLSGVIAAITSNLAILFPLISGFALLSLLLGMSESWRKESTPNKTGFDALLEREYKFALARLNNSRQSGRLSEALGESADTLGDAAWNRSRIVSALSTPLWSYPQASEDMRKLGKDLLSETDQALRRAIALSVMPPAEFHLTQSNASILVTKLCSFISSLANRLEAIAEQQGAETEALTSSEALLQLNAVEAAKAELNELIADTTQRAHG